MENSGGGDLTATNEFVVTNLLYNTPKSICKNHSFCSLNLTNEKSSLIYKSPKSYLINPNIIYSNKENLINILIILALYKLNIKLTFLFAFFQNRQNDKYNHNHLKYSITEYFSFINLSKLQRQVLKFNKLYINKFQINICFLMKFSKINKLKHPQKWTAPQKYLTFIEYPKQYFHIHSQSLKVF